MKTNLYENFKKYKVEADSVEDFLKKYTKPKRLEGRVAGYTEARIKSYTEELNKYGYCIMTHHESITGEVVSYYKE